MCNNSTTNSTLNPKPENGWHWSVWPIQPAIEVSSRARWVIGCGDDHGKALGVNPTTETTANADLGGCRSKYSYENFEDEVNSTHEFSVIKPG